MLYVWCRQCHIVHSTHSLTCHTRVSPVHSVLAMFSASGFLNLPGRPLDQRPLGSYTYGGLSRLPQLLPSLPPPIRLRRAPPPRDHFHPVITAQASSNSVSSSWITVASKPSDIAQASQGAASNTRAQSPTEPGGVLLAPMISASLSVRRRKHGCVICERLSQARDGFQITALRVKTARIASERVQTQSHPVSILCNLTERHWEGLHFRHSTSRRQNSFPRTRWIPDRCSSNRSSEEQRKIHLLGPSLRRHRRGVGAKGAVSAHGFELVHEGSRVSDRDLFGVGSLSICCEAPLARGRVKPSEHHPTGVSGLCLKNKCATFEKKRLPVSDI